MNDKILATVTKTKACPVLAREWGGKNGSIKATAQAYFCGRNKHPHFSVTATIFVDGRDQAGGCLHKEVAKYFPEFVPIIKMHLSHADDGEPMYAEENGWYWMSGALGGAGERYHGGTNTMNFPITPPADKPWQNTENRDPTQTECLQILADHLRISLVDADNLRNECQVAFFKGTNTVASSPEVTKATQDERAKVGGREARKVFAAFVEAQRPRWEKEAAVVLALIKALAL